MEKDNGGAAFPSKNAVQCGDYMTNGHPGMDLRDYFAAKAMQGMLSNESIVRSFEALSKKERQNMSDAMAGAVYAYADAMLAARGAK